MTKGIEFLFRKNKITWLKGHARLRRRRTTTAARSRSPAPARRRSTRANNVIIATGSKARSLAGHPRRQRDDLRQRGRARLLGGARKRLGVIGAGVIGLELGRSGAGSAPRSRSSRRCRTSSPPATTRWRARPGRSSPSRGSTSELGVKIGESRSAKKGVARCRTPTDKGNGAEARVDRLIVSVGRVPEHRRPGPAKRSA